MTQDSETRPPATAAGARGDDKGDFPGLLPATAVATLAAIVCWIWLISSAGPAMTPEGGAEVVTSELAQVDARDVAAALTTMDGSTDFLTQFKDRAPVAHDRWRGSPWHVRQGNRPERFVYGPELVSRRFSTCPTCRYVSLFRIQTHAKRDTVR
jgi:hypothetical protein